MKTRVTFQHYFLILVASILLISTGVPAEENADTIADTISFKKSSKVINETRIWQNTVPDTMKWNQAVSYCDSLELGGQDDWRLPTIDELQKIVDRSVEKAPYIKAGFNVSRIPFYWSTVEEGSALAHYLDFSGDGDMRTGKVNRLSVRCVRGPITEEK